jgi:DNA-binding transcriptional LysR family regulator
LADEPWVLPRPDAPYGKVVAAAFRANGLPLPRTLVTSTLPVRSQLLATGRYLSMIPRVTLQSPALKPWLRALPIALPTTLRPLAIVTLKNRTLAPAAQVFADHARVTARRLAEASAVVRTRGPVTRSGSAARSTA